ncbi:MAG: hypothetical protein IH987_22355 [Planctomycetes bacterium]|nr:hypothetical protein [Planctomycetota bacterium]
MWKACLSEPVVANILRQRFVVVSDPISAQNNTSFGVRVWAFTSDKTEVRNYWWGTGNCLIGRVFTEEYHRKRVKEMLRVLAEARQIAAGELQAAKEVNATVEDVDPDDGTLVVKVGFGENSREQKYKLSVDTAIVNGMNELKEVEALKRGLQSVLFEPGTRVRIATLTDKQGITEVLEVRITGRALFRRKSQ